MTKIETSLKEGFLEVSLNGPDRGNCLSPSSVREITQVIKTHKNNKDLKGIFFSGKGKNFCTGADLDWISKSAAKEDFSSFQEMYENLLDCDLPLIGEVQGKILGAGMGLTAIFDIVICEKQARFAMPEARWGLIPGIITPLVLKKIGSSRFTYHALTGLEISAQEALSWGLVHVLGTAEENVQARKKIFTCLQGQSLESLKKIKQSSRACSPFVEDIFSRMCLWSSQMKEREEVQERISGLRRS